MGILFRGREILRKQYERVAKKQYGGTIPFHASYTYQASPSVPYDPSTLLMKYQSAEKKTDKKEQSKDREDPKFTGLSNETNASIQEYHSLMDRISEGERSVDNFKNTALGQRMYADADALSSSRINDLRRNEKIHDQSVAEMVRKNGQDAYMYQNGSFLAKKVNPDIPNTYVYDWVDPVEMKSLKYENDQNVWSPVTYQEAAIERQSNPSKIFMFNPGFSEKISKGMGMDEVRKQIDGMFKDIGEEKYKVDSKINGYTVNEEEIKEAAKGKSVGSNSNNLKAVFNNMQSELRGTPAWNALISNFWIDSNTQTEVDEKLTQYLALHMMQRLKLNTEESSSLLLDLEKSGEGKSAGGGTTGVKNLSVFIPAFAGLTEKKEAAIEVPVVKKPRALGKLEYDKDKKTTITTFDAYTAVAANKLWKTEKSTEKGGKEIAVAVPLSNQTEFGLIADIPGVMLSDGTKISSLKSNFGGYEAPAMETMFPTISGGTHLVVLPVDKNTGGIVEIEGLEKFQEEYAKIQEERNNNVSASSGGHQATEDFDKKLKVLEGKYLGPYKNLVEYKKFYMVDAIYHNEKPPKEIARLQGKEIGERDYQAVKNALPELLNRTSSFRMESDNITDFSSITVFIPASNAMAHQMADKDASVYVNTDAVTGATMGSKPGNQGKDVTIEDILKSVTTKKAWSTTNYFNSKYF